MNVFFVSIRNLTFMTLFLGGVYPFLITSLSSVLFPEQSKGELVLKNNQIVGSGLIAQKFTKPEYFWSRPSAVDYAAHSAGASQKSVTSADLKKSVEERLEFWGKEAPVDLLYASGSGLDPHISPEAANYQASRVMKERGLTQEAIKKYILEATEDRTLGFMGHPRVNVLKLNLSLDR